MTREMTRRSATSCVASATPACLWTQLVERKVSKSRSLEVEIVLRSWRPFDLDKESWILSTAADEKTLTNKDQFVKG